jgi:glycosyltransferase involved in cell wall biosynthesis
VPEGPDAVVEPPAAPSVLLVVEQLRRRVPGGIGRYTRCLLRGLAEEGAREVTLFASRRPGHPGGRSGPVADPLAEWGLPVRTSRLAGRVLTRAWDRGLAPPPGGFDLVHSVSFAIPPVRSAGTARLATVHDLSWRRHPDATTPRGRRWHEAALGRALRVIDAFVVPSSAVADELVAAGAPRAAVAVIPWGGDHLPEPARLGAAGLLARAGVAGPYLLSVSTLEPRKNLARLAAAYGLARDRLPEPWPLVVVGPRGWGGAGLSDSPPPGVVPLGAVGDAVLAGLYAGARAFAYVPLTEGFGLPPLEAMGQGVPVVASATVPSAAGAAGRPSAWCVDPLDAEAIADGLVRVGTDEALRAELVSNGAARALSRTWRSVAQDHRALWRSLS